MKKIFLLLVVICLLVTGCSGSKDDKEKDKVKKVEVNNISVDVVKSMSDNISDYPDVSIVDVRNHEEYVAGHIKGAINIPLLKIEDIDIDTSNQIIVYCQSGKRSSQAAEKLINMGYKDVSDMGGINEWFFDLVTGEEVNNETNNYENMPGMITSPDEDM